MRHRTCESWYAIISSVARHKADICNLSYAQKFIDMPDGISAEIRVFSDTFTVAGSEATATLLTAATFFFLKNHSKLDILTKEIRTSLAHNSEITIASITSLRHLGAVIEEALRLIPPVSATSPRMTPNTGTMIYGHFVPPGAAVGVAPWPAHNSPLNFRDPDECVLERWLGHPRYADDKKSVLQPFSIGPRNCIGRT